jgi:WD40 repeat protein
LPWGIWAGILIAGSVKRLVRSSGFAREFLEHFFWGAVAMLQRGLFVSLCVLATSAIAFLDATVGNDDQGAATVSYYQQVRPIFQARCHGCHQPAKASGDFDMTTPAGWRKGGESELPAIVAGNPDESYLIELITPSDGEAEMPQGAPPLSDEELKVIRQWIVEGAVDDSPAKDRAPYDREHPPVYSRPPVITSLDFSPDASQLAVSGFHEVLLVPADGGEAATRLIGMSERIEAVQFSPDGKQLAVTGGSPGRMGEIQVWNVAASELALSRPVTFDTVFGGSWSPDGTHIAFGCTDNTVRVIDAETGEEIVYMAAHDDFVRDTVFSGDGKSIFSVSRDKTVKMTDLATQRFVGNVTTHTPGVLQGGMSSIVRHPSREEIVVGGADGVPKLFRMDVKAAPASGGNPNQIREYAQMLGRIFDVCIQPDGLRLFAASSLNGAGNIRGYETDSGKQLWNIDLPQTAIYALACSPDGTTLAAGGADGIVRLIDTAAGSVRAEFLPAQVTPEDQLADAPTPDFIRDVNPILSRLGCNAGTCHGAAQGKNGFKLSLRGYDAQFDVRALTDDLASRRVNVASPVDSLMLLKATSTVPHQGGQLLQPGDAYYQLIYEWIAGGATLNLETPRVKLITLEPVNPVIDQVGQTCEMQVTATYADGSTRDVTREAFIESGNTEVATAGQGGLMTAVRRGEAPVLARYEGAYAATTITVMGNRDGFVWEQPNTWSHIDELVAAKWQRLKIRPSPLCSDAEFFRRVNLDLTGLPPTSDEVRRFLTDTRDTRTKRNELIDQLIGSEDFIDHWTNKWADLLQVNRKYLGAEGAAAFRTWIREQIAANTAYDEFARKILTATGSNRENPAASYYKILRDPLDTMENTTQLFLAVRFNCNKCHDHPFERWTQDQYYQTAAYFARLDLTKDPASGDSRIGGSAVEGAKPLYEIVGDKGEGEVVHDRTKEVAAPQFPFECKFETEAGATRRQQLAAWITSPDNAYFASSYVNRLWGYLLGNGLIEPLDDIRAGNPPTNPELLKYLTREFVDSGFDVRHVMRLICRSRTYQLSVETNAWNVDDTINYSHATARRLPAEVLYDAIHRVVGSTSAIPGVPAGTRAAALPDAGVKLADGFLANLGRPARESACECERTNNLQLGPVMALISGPTVGKALTDPRNTLTSLANSDIGDAELINELYYRILNRPATQHEIDSLSVVLTQLPQEHSALVDRLARYEEQLNSDVLKKESERVQAIESAQADLAAYEKQIAPQEAALEKKRQERIAEAGARVKDYENHLPEQLDAWEKVIQEPVEWLPLKATELTSTNQAQLEQQEDLSVWVSGENGKTTYRFVSSSDVTDITGVKLELLADERLPMKGPGRAPNGNFVLSELRLAWAPASQPENMTPVTLQHAQADFSQQGYDVKTAIDGQVAPQGNGWAGAGKLGENRTAVFETKQNIGDQAGLLSFELVQEFADGQHSIGRFRLSVTTASRPVLLKGLPSEITAVLNTPPDQRTDAQRAELLKYYRGVDSELQRLEQALATARQPRAMDPGLQQRRDKLARANKVPLVDPKLTELRDSVRLSAQQIKSARLTFTQDLAWALLNSPAFLFNR